MIEYTKNYMENDTILLAQPDLETAAEYLKAATSVLRPEMHSAIKRLLSAENLSVEADPRSSINRDQPGNPKHGGLLVSSFDANGLILARAKIVDTGNPFSNFSFENWEHKDRTSFMRRENNSGIITSRRYEGGVLHEEVKARVLLTGKRMLSVRTRTHPIEKKLFLHYTLLDNGDGNFSLTPEYGKPNCLHLEACDQVEGFGYYTQDEFGVQYFAAEARQSEKGSYYIFNGHVYTEPKLPKPEHYFEKVVNHTSKQRRKLTFNLAGALLKVTRP